MSKVDFTPEQIFAAAELFKSYVTDYELGKTRPGFSDYLDSLLRSKKRKKIFIEIECDDSVKRLDRIVDTIENWFAESGNPKVTILPEVFTREDLARLVRHTVKSDATLTDLDILDSFLSERSKK